DVAGRAVGHVLDVELVAAVRRAALGVEHDVGVDDPGVHVGEGRRVAGADDAAALALGEQRRGLVGLDALRAGPGLAPPPVAPGLVGDDAVEPVVAGDEPHRGGGAHVEPLERVVDAGDGPPLRPPEPVAHVDDDLVEELLLVLEVPVDEALGHTGGRGDVDHAGVLVAPLGEQLLGVVQQLGLAVPAVAGQAPLLGRHPRHRTRGPRRRASSATPRRQGPTAGGQVCGTVEDVGGGSSGGVVGGGSSGLVVGGGSSVVVVVGSSVVVVRGGAVVVGRDRDPSRSSRVVVGRSSAVVAGRRGETSSSSSSVVVVVLPSSTVVVVTRSRRSTSASGERSPPSPGSSRAAPSTSSTTTARAAARAARRAPGGSRSSHAAAAGRASRRSATVSSPPAAAAGAAAVAAATAPVSAGAPATACRAARTRAASGRASGSLVSSAPMISLSRPGCCCGRGGSCTTAVAVAIAEPASNGGSPSTAK